MKYLKFYKSCMKTGKLPKLGLCQSFDNALLDLFVEKHPVYGEDWYWGYGQDYNWRSLTREQQEVIMRDFTPTRQNIVLFLAAMNGEL